MSRRNIQSSLDDLRKNIDSHIDGYIKNLEEELKAVVTNLRDDFIGEDEEDTSADELMRAVENSMLKGKHAFIDKINEFYKHDGDYVYESSYELGEAFDKILEDHGDSIKDEDTSDKEATFDKLKELGEKLHLTDSQTVQNEIYYLLKDEFGIDLVLAPQKNY